MGGCCNLWDIVIQRRDKSSQSFWGLVRVPPSQTLTQIDGYDGWCEWQ